MDLRVSCLLKFLSQSAAFQLAVLLQSALAFRIRHISRWGKVVQHGCEERPAAGDTLRYVVSFLVALTLLTRLFLHDG